MVTASELSINSDVSALEMADAMFGSGIKIVSASYTGASGAKGIYSGADTTSPGLAPSDSGVILSTGKVSDITQSSGDPNTVAGMSTDHKLAGDADLSEIAGAKTFDAAVIEASFVPQGSTLTMQVTFSSEEYLEYVNGGYNDAVGIWVNGEKAELTVGGGDISVDNINDKSNANLYLDNPSSKDLINTEMDGVSVTMTLKAPVKPGEINTIKIGIADAGDGVYDSNLLIAGDSIQTALIADDDSVDLGGQNEVTFDVTQNDSSTAGGKLVITHINGQEVSAGDSIKLASGEIVTLNAAGTLTLLSDGLDGGDVFSYTVEDSAGNTDTAFVTMTSTVPCFTAGTLIATSKGLVPVECLGPGDLVFTRDHGLQPVRWAGKAERRASGKDAPVLIAAGTLGEHGPLEVSPQHRLLIVDARAALLFGQTEVLVRARDLIDGKRIVQPQHGGPVCYIHLLFDRHEIVLSGGLFSESYHPGPRTTASFDDATREELFRLFPELASLGRHGFGHTARLSLKQHEARVLLGRVA
jgi:hypothetical protein